MRINYNISSIIAKNALNNNDSRLSISTQKLSSGYKILSAKDDAAGLAIARKMNMQIKALERANQNSNDGLSVVDTADGAMTEMHSILQRMNELSIQAANGTNSDDDRSQIQLEIDQLVDEIDRIADTTQFNAQNLLDGSFAYKAYTNNENVKVMSYSEDVSKGTYLIGGLTFYKYGDEKITYANGSTTTKTNEDYQVENSSDAIKNALNMTPDNDNDIQGFPAGSKVTVDNEYIYIKDEEGFEMKLYVNDNENLTNVKTTTISTSLTASSVSSTTGTTATATTSATTQKVSLVSYIKTDIDSKTNTETRYNYDDIKVTDDKGNEYTIGHLITVEDNNNNTWKAYSDSDSRNQGYKGIEESLGIDNITSVTVDSGLTSSTITVNYLDPSDSTPKTKTYNITNDIGAYYSYKSERDVTEYTVGTAEEPLAIEVTKMGPMIVQTGANEGQQLEIEIPQLNSRNLGINGLSVSTQDDATASIDIVGKAINQLSSVRAKIGAYANRLEHTITNLDTTVENMTESYSRIMDVDMAEEMTEYTNMQVLVQAATSVLAQANEMPQQVLQLLQ
jgi:flagellin